MMKGEGVGGDHGHVRAGHAIEGIKAQGCVLDEDGAPDLSKETVRD